jgi:hypothetical protein
VTEPELRSFKATESRGILKKSSNKAFRHQENMAAPTLESRRRRTKGSVVGEEWCQNAAPLR